MGILVIASIIGMIVGWGGTCVFGQFLFRALTEGGDKAALGVMFTGIPFLFFLIVAGISQAVFNHLYKMGTGS